MSNLELVLVIGTTMLIWGCTYSYLKIVRVDVRVSDLERKLTLTQEMIHSQAEYYHNRYSELIKGSVADMERLEGYQNRDKDQLLTHVNAELKRIEESYSQKADTINRHNAQVERGLRVIEESMEVIKGLVK